MIHCELNTIIGVFILTHILVWVNVFLIHYFVKCVLEAFGLKPTVSNKRKDISHQEECSGNEYTEQEDDNSIDMNGLYDYPEEEHYTSLLYDDDVEIVTPEQEVAMERSARR